MACWIGVELIGLNYGGHLLRQTLKPISFHEMGFFVFACHRSASLTDNLNGFSLT